MLRAGHWFVLLIMQKNMCCKASPPRPSPKERGANTAFLLLLFQFYFFNFQFSLAQSSCTCDETKLVFSQSYTNAHKLIFRGKTLVIANGEGFSKVTFIVTQLFKGSSTKEVDVYFDGKAACNLKFTTGEDWLIYANYKQIKKPFVEYCSRSRKNVINTNKNIELTYIKSDLTVDAESEKLREQLGLQNFSAQEKEEDNNHNNIIPGFWQRIVLILCSIGGFVLIYFGTNKLLKR